MYCDQEALYADPLELDRDQEALHHDQEALYCDQEALHTDPLGLDRDRKALHHDQEVMQSSTTAKDAREQDARTS